jgi:hypothetical protein
MGTCGLWGLTQLTVVAQKAIAAKGIKTADLPYDKLT